MSLEEFPPNREFVGRNFNAGEVIQLVLKSPSTGRWLPFEYVQMVMMHELAHCKQMNHSRAFWAVRNQYATQMYSLWSKGYTGDGLWGRGASLSTGEWEKNKVLADEVLPEHLCGGTYRSRGRKRKAKPTLTYQQQKERRILKKFGKNGMALGADDDTKVKLEKGKKVQGKPRVAGSARGRELRAAAALARFEQAKPEQDVKDEDVTDSGGESDFEDADLDFKDALDLDGSRLVDDKGRGMIRICEDEAQDDPGAIDATKELQNVLSGRIKAEPIELDDDEEPTQSISASDGSGSNGNRRTQNLWDIPAAPASIIQAKARGTSKAKLQSETTRQATTKTANDMSKSSVSKRTHTDVARVECGICTFANAPSAVRCEMCAHVLAPASDPRAWACMSDMCKTRGFVNAGDCGVCCLCGKKKP